MSEHVDVTGNDWLAGTQSLLARVTFTPDGLEVDSDSPQWAEHVRATMAASSDPDPFEALACKYDGMYVWATAPHDDRDCPFGQGTRLPMRTVKATP